MAGVAIVTGSPGAGKTTLCARLAATSSAGVHIESDLFYRFVENPVSPVLPESDAQNRTVIRAVLRAASAFAQGGYDVWLDGIFGPWMLPLIAEELSSAAIAVDYVILRGDGELLLHRATSRGENPAPAHVVQQMHREFERFVHETGHGQEVTALTPAEAAAEISRKRQLGEFRLDLAWAASSRFEL